MTTTRTRLAAAAVPLLLLAAACGDDADPSASTTTAAVDAADQSTTPAPERGEEVVIEGAWARTSPMMATNGAAYMVITSPVDDRLLAASVDASIAAQAEVHETSMNDDGSGEMRMVEVEAIELPAGTPVALEPGGYHVMLMDLAAPLEVGTAVEITIELEAGGTIVVVAEVRDA